jgi:uncharacterized membrane-anchored protein
MSYASEEKKRGEGEGMASDIKSRWNFHPNRDALLAEAHARPFVLLETPMLAARIATLSGNEGEEIDRQHMVKLCRRLGQPEPSPDARWAAVADGSWQLRWERHTEFSTWTFFRQPTDAGIFGASAFGAAPQDWLAEMPGDVLVSAILEVRARDTVPNPADYFAKDMVGSSVMDWAASVYSDFRTDGDGTTRFLILTGVNNPPLAGRLARSLLEVETYRLMSLLAFPLAGEAGGIVSRIEQEAGALAAQLKGETNPENDRKLLARLAELAGEAEALSLRTNFRFGAANAYHEIIHDRLSAIREEQEVGVQTFSEFMERRLGPAMRTCASVARREAAVIERIARTGQMLSIRVQVASEAASVALLKSMDKRASDQLRLQRTVEGLSVAAISYYVIGLLLYVAKAIEHMIPRFDPVLVVGLSAPMVALGVWLILRKLRATVDVDR